MKYDGFFHDKRKNVHRAKTAKINEKKGILGKGKTMKPIKKRGVRPFFYFSMDKVINTTMPKIIL